MIFDRIEDWGSGLCVVFRMDMEKRTGADGRISFIHISIDKKEQAYDEPSLVQFIANVERETGRMNCRAVEARLALVELRRRIAKGRGNQAGNQHTGG